MNAWMIAGLGIYTFFAVMLLGFGITMAKEKGVLNPLVVFGVILASAFWPICIAFSLGANLYLSYGRDVK